VIRRSGSVTDCDAVVWPIQRRMGDRLPQTRRHAICDVIHDSRYNSSNGGGVRYRGYSVSIKTGAEIESTSVGSSQPLVCGSSDSAAEKPL